MASSRKQLNFGDNLLAARRQAGLSQDQLGKRAGIPKNTIYRLEVGDREPRLSTVLRLADALGMEGSDLIRGLKPG